MTDGEMLLAAVLAHPAEDTPRLAYADWLQENGDDERAEFVRVQVELARHCDHGHGVARPHGGGCDTCDRLAALGKRERGLLTALRESLRFDLPGPRPACRAWGLYLSRHEDGTPDDFTCAFGRGFVSAVCCPAAAWLEHGPAIVARHPVERVVLADKEPARSRYRGNTRGRYVWVEGSVISDRDGPGDMPRDIWRCGFGTGLWLPHVRSENAVTALSAACLAWARAQLPALG